VPDARCCAARAGRSLGGRIGRVWRVRTREGSYHPLGTKYVGNITVKTGRCLSSATRTVHRRKSGAQSAKEETIITRFIRRTAMECAAVRSLTSLPMLSGKS
jgi:hypothetical protein